MRYLPWVVFLSALSLCGCRTHQHPTDIARHQDIIHRYFEKWANHGDIATADAVIATNLTLHNPPSVQRSLDEYKAGMATFHRGFPDLHFTIEDEIYAGDKVVVRWQLRGTQQGEFQGHAPS